MNDSSSKETVTATGAANEEHIDEMDALFVVEIPTNVRAGLSKAEVEYYCYQSSN